MSTKKDLIQTSYELINERPLYRVGTASEFEQNEINSAYNKIVSQLAALINVQKGGSNWINKDAKLKKSMDNAIKAHKDLISTFEDIIT